MASITKKLFVNVLSGVEAPVNYDENKIYFINEAKKIFAKGVYYGVSEDDFAAYKKALGTFLYNQDSKDYEDVPTAITAAIATIDKKVSESKTLKVDGEVYEVATSIKYDDTNKKIDFLDKEGTVLSSVATSDIIGNQLVKNSEYDSATGILKMTFDNGTDTGLEVDIDLKDILDISDVVSVDKYVNATIKTNTEGDDNNQLEISVNVCTDFSTLGDNDTLLADAKTVVNYVTSLTSKLQDSIDALTKRVEDNEKAIETLQLGLKTVRTDFETADTNIITAYVAADAALDKKISDLTSAYVYADEKLYTTYIKPNADAIILLNSDVNTEGSVKYTATDIVVTTMEDLTNYWEESK